jgi:hypothetical protein
MPAVRIFFKFFRQVPIIVTAGKILCDAHQAEFESTEITPETALKICQKLSAKKGQNRQPLAGYTHHHQPAAAGGI